MESWRQVYVWNGGEGIMAANRKTKCSSLLLWRRDPKSAHLRSLGPTKEVLIRQEVYQKVKQNDSTRGKFQGIWVALNYHVSYNEIKLWETLVNVNDNHDNGWSLTGQQTKCLHQQEKVFLEHTSFGSGRTQLRTK